MDALGDYGDIYWEINRVLQGDTESIGLFLNDMVPPSNQDLTGDQNLPDDDMVPPSNQDLTGDQNLPDDDMVPPPSNQNTATGVHSEYDFNDDQISISYEEGTCPTVTLSENWRKDVFESWENKSLIVKPFNRSVKRYVLLEQIKKKWSPRGEWELIDLDNGFYVVKFSSSDDINYVFNEGPWIILGDYLTIQKWRPGIIHPSSGSLLPSTATAAWVRFPDLPIEYCHNHKLLWALGNKIGTVILVDPKTRFASKRRFARVCVEIDLSKDVITEFKLAGVLHRVEYEHLKVDGGKVRGVCKVHRGRHRAMNRPQPVQPGVSGPAHRLPKAEPGPGVSGPAHRLPKAEPGPGVSGPAHRLPKAEPGLGVSGPAHRLPKAEPGLGVSGPAHRLPKAEPIIESATVQAMHDEGKVGSVCKLHRGGHD